METKKQLIQKMKDELVAYALPRRSLEACSKDYLQTMYDSAVKLNLTKKAQAEHHGASSDICLSEEQTKTLIIQGYVDTAKGRVRCHYTFRTAMLKFCKGGAL